jgi:hypothetical protein
VGRHSATGQADWLLELIGLSGGQWTHQACCYSDPHRKAHPKLAATAQALVMERLPSLTGQTLAEAVYALCEGGGSTPQEILPLLKESERRDECGLGVYWWAARRPRLWPGEERKKAIAGLEFMRPLVTRPELQEQIASLGR